MNFTGFCSYPLGGSTTGTLILATGAALAATVYATVSCRFVALTFTAATGGLEEYYSQQDSSLYRGTTTPTSLGNETTTPVDEGEFMTFKAAVGLYQWLRPTDITDNNWSVGTCAGYQQSMLAEITDPFFDMSRSFAVFAVILAIFQVCWMLLSACMSMNRIQAYLFCILAFAGTASTGLTFLFHRSALCQTQFQSRECVVDEGGLVMIAASVLWMVTFCISICFVVPTVLAETSSIDFERQDAHDRAKIAAKKTKDDANRLRGRSNTKPNASSSRRSKSKSDRASQQQNNDKTRTTILAVQQSYSYDSQASWTKRIPTRSGFTDDVLQERPTKAKSSLLIVPGKRTPSLSLPQRSSQQQLQPQQQQRYGPLSSQTLFRTAAQPNTGSTHVQDSVENYIAKRLDRIEALSADVP